VQAERFGRLGVERDSPAFSFFSDTRRGAFMRRFLSAVLLMVLATGVASPVRAADDDAKTILDKAIKALGGEENLSKVKAATWKGKGKINFGGTENEFTSQTTVQGLDHVRSEFEGEIMGNKFKGVTVLAGTKGWRKFGDMEMELDKDALANEKRSVYLQVIPMTLLPLKGKGFKLQTAGEEKVNGKAAVSLKVTAPDGKDFTLYFDKESGFPVKQVAKVMGFMGEEVTQETTFSDYKEFQGIKKSTKSEGKRAGEKFLESQITSFKILDKVDPKTFTKPE
jgi:hypothetical protein